MSVTFSDIDLSKELAKRGAGFTSLTGRPSYETVKNEGDHGKKGGQNYAVHYADTDCRTLLCRPVGNLHKSGQAGMGLHRARL